MSRRKTEEERNDASIETTDETQTQTQRAIGGREHRKYLNTTNSIIIKKNVQRTAAGQEIVPQAQQNTPTDEPLVGSTQASYANRGIRPKRKQKKIKCKEYRK